MAIKTTFLILFFTGAALNIGFSLDVNAHRAWFDLSKYLLMPFLGAYAWFALPSHFKHKTVLFVGLVFYWGGDVLLTFVARSPLYFTLGLGSFLVGHVFLIACMLKLRAPKRRALHWAWFVLPVAYAAGFLWYLNGLLGALLPFVVAYSVALSALLGAAMLRYRTSTRPSFLWTLLGSVLFVASDSLIGINKFHHPLAHADFLIMLTYISAVFFMVRGVVLHRDATAFG